MSDRELQTILKSKMISAAIAAELAEREKSNTQALKVTLVEFINKLRVTKKMTEGEICDLLRCSRMTLKNWERGIALSSDSDSNNRIPMNLARIAKAESGPSGPSFVLRRKKGIPNKGHRWRLMKVARETFDSRIEIDWTA